MRTLFFSTLATIVFGLQACKNDKAKTEESQSEQVMVAKPKYEAAAPTVRFKDPKVDAVYSAYIGLKTQLVNTDASTSAKAAESLVSALADVEVAEETAKAAKMIAASDNIEEQRGGFEQITIALEPILVANIEGGTIYKQYCPMAFKNKGAYWLSNSKEIYNPYFGDVMLHCGRVADTLQLAEAE